MTPLNQIPEIPSRLLLNGQETAALLAISYATLKLAIENGTAPPHIVVGRRRRWNPVAVAKWAQQNPPPHRAA